ncbi:MAG TPA: zinc ribbon domain-containing protein [Burkholderiaceae bacterium]|nr:zinc ribbon domain-containing protein [Burkholderiaceae bacterium]
MPTYDYRCAACGDFSTVRPIAQRDLDSLCPACGAASPRVMFAAPMFSRLAAQDRTAHETNERASHEPKSSRDYRLRHMPGCSCCSSGTGARRASTLRLANGAKTFPGRRPWQISH